jgi:hypothetical protein
VQQAQHEGKTVERLRPEMPDRENVMGLLAIAKSFYPSKRESPWRWAAKFAAGNLADWKSKWLLLKAAETNNKKFFVDLGKMLSGDLDSTSIDPMEFDIARVLTRYPSISEKDALRELEKLNPKYKQLKLGTFRVRKGRILRRASVAYEAYRQFFRKAAKQA